MTRYLDRILNPDDTPLRWLSEHLTNADTLLQIVVKEIGSTVTP